MIEGCGCWDWESHVEVFCGDPGGSVATYNLPVGVVSQGCHNFQLALLKLSTVVADVLRDVIPWQEPVEFPSEFQAKGSSNYSIFDFLAGLGEQLFTNFKSWGTKVNKFWFTGFLLLWPHLSSHFCLVEELKNETNVIEKLWKSLRKGNSLRMTAILGFFDPFFSLNAKWRHRYLIIWL